MLSLIYQWIDLLWIPAALLMVHPGQRVKTVFFILACILTLRLQLELMSSFGYPDGFLGWVGLGLYERGLILYGILFALFLILAHLSPNTRGVIFFAATLSLYFIGFFVSMIAMVF